jgi:Fur family transcriptional regulator, peroxide stress response regulator
VNDTRDIFARHGLRFTPQRRAIYETLCRTKTHPTAEMLFRQVQAITGSVSLATVYNTLDALAEAGLVQKIPSESGCCRYDANTDEHLHVRIAETGEICDVPHELSSELLEALPRNVIEKIERATGSRIESVNIQFTARRADHLTRD